jgi:hypothetical protein
VLFFFVCVQTSARDVDGQNPQDSFIHAVRAKLMPLHELLSSSLCFFYYFKVYFTYYLLGLMHGSKGAMFPSFFFFIVIAPGTRGG